MVASWLERKPFGIKLNWCRALNFANIFAELNELGEVWGVIDGGHIGKGDVAILVVGD